MKRTASLILAAALALTGALFLPVSAAETVTDAEVTQILGYLGIMQGYPDGSFGATDPVTRAQMAKVLILTSVLRDTVPASLTSSPYPDVSFRHWGAPYVKACLSAGYMKGYVNGTFGPEQGVLYEEALCACLRLLGYSDAEMGAYPAGPIATAGTLGLTQGVGGRQGERLTRQQVARMVYNVLNTVPKGAGKTQFEQLGYQKAGTNVRVSDLVSDSMAGPYVYMSGSLASAYGLDAAAVTVWRDGMPSSLADILPYDVVYVSAFANTVWAYSQKAYGELTAILPNRAAPQSVSVGGVTYALSTDSAAHKLSAGGLDPGMNVVLLLDQDGKVADILSAAQYYGQAAGIVQSVTARTMSGAVAYYAEILLANGQTMSAALPAYASYAAGSAVTVRFANGVALASASAAGVSGRVDAQARKIGAFEAATNLSILDVGTKALSVSLTRLDGVDLSGANILCAVLNDKGQVEQLILDNVTRDGESYGYLLSGTETVSNMTARGSYKVDVAGQTTTLTLSSSVLGFTSGPVRLYAGQQGQTADKLTRVDRAVVSVNELYVELADGTRLPLTAGVAVYTKVNGTYVYCGLELAKGNPAGVEAYIDRAASSGGRVRVLVVT